MTRVKILSIDPGTRRAGYAIFEIRGNSPRMVECGLVLIRGKDLPERLLNIHRGIERLVRRLHPKHVVIEQPFVGKSIPDAMTLNCARAVAMVAAAAAKARVYDYSPSEVKRAVSGNGLTSKAGVQRMVQLQLGLKYLPEEDVADALALGLCHINRL